MSWPLLAVLYGVLLVAGTFVAVVAWVRSECAPLIMVGTACGLVLAAAVVWVERWLGHRFPVLPTDVMAYVVALGVLAVTLSWVVHVSRKPFQRHQWAIVGRNSAR